MNAKRALCLFMFLLFQTRLAYAQGSFDTLLNPSIGKQRELIDSWVDASSGTVPVTRASLASFTPIWHNTNTEVGFTATGKLMSIGDQLTLPSTGDMMPETFGQLNFGPTVRYKFTNGWVLGGNAFAGSASNQPFANVDTLEVTANAALLIPTEKGGLWMFFLNYSSNRDFLSHIPIPGFGYAVNKDWGRGVLGIPAIHMHLLPMSKVNFKVRYFPIIRTYADIGWNPVVEVRLAAFFEWDDDHYWRTSRAIDNRQIFYVEKSLGGSVALKLYKDIDLKVDVGWGFNRYFFEGRSIIKDTDYNRIDLDSAPFFSAQLSARI